MVDVGLVSRETITEESIIESLRDADPQETDNDENDLDEPTHSIPTMSEGINCLNRLKLLVQSLDVKESVFTRLLDVQNSLFDVLLTKKKQKSITDYFKR